MSEELDQLVTIARLTRELNDERVHVQVAHSKIIKMRDQLRTLHHVIARRKGATRRLRDYVDAVKRLHRPANPEQLNDTKCHECVQPWPCRTHEAIYAVAYDALPDSVKSLVTNEDTGK
jgi:hypothetical protein